MPRPRKQASKRRTAHELAHERAPHFAAPPCSSSRGRALAQTKGLLRLPEFASLADKASESVNVTLDANLLGMGCRFLNAEDPEQASAKKLCTGLTGIYVRSYTFDTDFAYPKADVDGVRRQLAAPGWSRIVEAKSRKEQTDVDVFVLIDNGKARKVSRSSRASRASSRSSTSWDRSTWNSCTISKESSAYRSSRSKRRPRRRRKRPDDRRQSFFPAAHIEISFASRDTRVSGLRADVIQYNALWRYDGASDSKYSNAAAFALNCFISAGASCALSRCSYA